ncbi:MAG: TetR family transcriptional regulator [Deltaproteobacteria bacterium]|nr:MAG: TetR family transcriptional regulator [Deltaproteobacteria bacterium]
MGIETFFNIPIKKREKIIEASTKEFAHRGYSGASINSIITRIGIAKGSIFNYFGDKNGLFLYIFNYSVEKVKDYLRDVRLETSKVDFFSRLRQILQAGVEFTEKYPDIYRLYIRMILHSDIPLGENLQKSVREYAHDFLCGLLYEAIEKNEIKPEINVGVTAFAIEAVMDRFLQTRILPYLDPGTGLYNAAPEQTEKLINEIIEILKNGISI